MTRKKGKIAICHYRIGRTDGVSLEIQKRKSVLEKMGYKIILISGSVHVGADFVIPELEFDRPDIVKIKTNAFFKFKDYRVPYDLMKDIYRIGNIIEKKLIKIYKKEKFDTLIAHNIFSHGRHIAAARGFYNFAANTPVRVIAVNHDFYSTYLGMYAPQTKEVKKYLREYVPPRSKKINKHVVISSPRQKLLKQLSGRHAMIFPDTFNFNQPRWKKDNYNKNFLKTFGLKKNDLMILQATRIVERKAIELSIDLISELNKRKKELIGKKLWNGKIMDEKSDIVFCFGQFVEPASIEYKKRLIQKMKKQGIKYKFMSSRIAHKRTKRKDKKIYSLWDAYVYSDLISYPSIVEGWGNQFIEAVFAKKPIFIFEYPVFKADIKPEGYKIVSLGSTFKWDKNKFAIIEQSRVKKTAREVIKVLTDNKTNKILDKNWLVGKKYHGEKTLIKSLKKCIS